MKQSSSRPAVRIQAHISGAVDEQLLAAQREIVRAQRRGIKTAGEKAILPKARAAVERETPVAAGQVVVKTTRSDGMLSVRQRRASRIIGWLNYGGTVPAVKGRVMHFRADDGTEIFTRRIRARYHEGEHFLEAARDAGFPEYERILFEEIMTAFDGLEHTP